MRNSQNNNQLHLACQAGNLEEVRHIYNCSGTRYFYKKNQAQNIPLQCAINAANWPVVMFLLPKHDVRIFQQGGMTIAVSDPRRTKTVFCNLAIRLYEIKRTDFIAYYQLMQIIPDAIIAGGREYADRHSFHHSDNDFADNIYPYREDGSAGYGGSLLLGELEKCRARLRAFIDLKPFDTPSVNKHVQAFLDEMKEGMRKTYFKSIWHLDANTMFLLESFFDEAAQRDIIRSGGSKGHQLPCLIVEAYSEWISKRERVIAEQGRRTGHAESLAQLEEKNQEWHGNAIKSMEFFLRKVIAAGVGIDESGSQSTTTPLEYAVRNAFPEAARLLHRLGARLSSDLWRLCISNSQSWGRQEFFSVSEVLSGEGRSRRRRHDYPSYQYSRSAQQQKAPKARDETLAFLEEVKAPVDTPCKGGSTPLLWAIDSSDVSLVERLVRLGASLAFVRLPQADLDSEKSDAKKSRLSFTPLMLAAQQGAGEIVSVLLRAGADPNVINEEGASALFYAFATGKRDVIDCLKEVSDTNLCMRNASTLLLIAALRKDVSLIEMALSDFKCDVNQPRKDGLTSLMVVTGLPCKTEGLRRPDFPSGAPHSFWGRSSRAHGPRGRNIPNISVEEVECSVVSAIVRLIEEGADPAALDQHSLEYGIDKVVKHLVREHEFFELQRLVDAGVKINEAVGNPEDAEAPVIASGWSQQGSEALYMEGTGLVHYLLSWGSTKERHQKANQVLTMLLAHGISARILCQYTGEYYDQAQLVKEEVIVADEDRYRRSPSPVYDEWDDYGHGGYDDYPDYSTRRSYSSRRARTPSPCLVPKTVQVPLTLAPIHRAVLSDNVEAIKLLVQFDPSVVHQALSGEKGLYPVHLAKSAAALHALFASGADMYSIPAWRVAHGNPCSNEGLWGIELEPMTCSNVGEYYRDVLFDEWTLDLDFTSLHHLIEAGLDLGKMGLRMRDFLFASIEKDSLDGVRYFLAKAQEWGEDVPVHMLDAAGHRFSPGEDSCFSLLIEGGFRLSTENSKEFPVLRRGFSADYVISIIGYLCFLVSSETQLDVSVFQKNATGHDRLPGMDTVLQFKAVAQYCVSQILQGNLIPEDIQDNMEFVLSGFLRILRAKVQIYGVKQREIDHGVEKFRPIPRQSYSSFVMQAERGAFNSILVELTRSYMKLSLMIAEYIMASETNENYTVRDKMMHVLLYVVGSDKDESARVLKRNAFGSLMNSNVRFPQSLLELLLDQEGNIDSQKFDVFCNVAREVCERKKQLYRMELDDDRRVTDRYGLFAELKSHQTQVKASVGEQRRVMNQYGLVCRASVS